MSATILVPLNETVDAVQDGAKAAITLTDGRVLARVCVDGNGQMYLEIPQQTNMANIKPGTQGVRIFIQDV